MISCSVNGGQNVKVAPIPPGYVPPVNHALQEHPEAPCLWERHVHDILVNQLNFFPTTHEKCLYSRRDFHDNLQMILRQVDDFSVSATEQQECRKIIDKIGAHLNLGIIRKFNGENVQQKGTLKFHAKTIS